MYYCLWLPCFQMYTKEAVDHVQEALTKCQKDGNLSNNIFEVCSPSLIAMYDTCLNCLNSSSLSSSVWRCSQTLLGSPYAILLTSISFCRGHIGRQLSADKVFCQVFLGLPTGAFLSTTNLVHALIQSASSFLSTCPCRLSLHPLITSPIASTSRRLLSSVLSFFRRNTTHPPDHPHLCLSFRETRPIHLIILISVLSVFDSSSALMAHVSHPYNMQLPIVTLHAKYIWSFMPRDRCFCCIIYEPQLPVELWELRCSHGQDARTLRPASWLHSSKLHGHDDIRRST